MRANKMRNHLNGSRSLLGFWTSKNGSPDAIEFGVSLWRILLQKSF
jgi:hypothetical protein